MRAPLVSVILPVFNAAPFIRDTLRSALRQTYRHLEVIVVDDGSDDDTVKIVETMMFEDARVRLVRQPNAGVAAARNRGIAEALGELIAPLDADDIWDPRKLELQVACLERGGSATGFVYCWWVWIDERGHVLDTSPRWEVEGHVHERLVEINFTGNASVPLFRKRCIEEVGGYASALRDKGAQGCEDWDLAIRIAERYRVGVVPAALVGYRRHPDGMSRLCDTMWKSQALILDGMRRRQPAVSASTIRRSRGQFALHLAGISFWSGDYARAVAWGLRAWRHGIGFAVIPYVARVLTRRFLRLDRKRPYVAADPDGFDRLALPPSLIPYDRLYGRRWSRRRGLPAPTPTGWRARRGEELLKR